MGKASLNSLYDLHQEVAKYYLEVLKSGEMLSSGTLAAINAFLKNNDIKVDVVDSDAKQPLAFKLQELIEKAG